MGKWIVKVECMTVLSSNTQPIEARDADEAMKKAREMAQNPENWRYVKYSGRPIKFPRAISAWEKK